MKRIGEVIQLNKTMIPRSDTTPGQEKKLFEPVCQNCNDTLFETMPSGAVRPCACRYTREKEQALSLIPAEFAEANLKTLKPDMSRHPKQAEKIRRIKAEPEKSYLLFGDNGTGKSFLGWALYRHAVESGRKVVMRELDNLLKDYRRWEFTEAESGFRPAVTANDLIESRRPYTIFLDEIGATTPTEYAAKEFFGLIKAAHEYNHQMLYTCNISPEALQKHWSRQDEFWGNSIARRIAEYSVQVNLFR